jgi:hypothetical protein
MRDALLCLLAGLSLACNGGLPDSADAGRDTSPAPDAASDRGPTLNTVCGLPGITLETACSAYCTNISRYCRTSNAQFASGDDCEEVCNRPTWSCGTPDDLTGNTVFCRNSYAARAMMDPDTNCPQAGPDSDHCR